MIWQECNGQEYIKPLSGTLYRLVESQSQIATMDYVDNIEEQAVLESLLEDSKPALPDETGPLHYLLKTPFRYPPLKWGSRFSGRDLPSLFYGAAIGETCLAEAAFYRLVFLDSMEGSGEGVAPNAVLRSRHTMFCIGYQTQKGISLDAAPFDRYFDLITHKQDYMQTQMLGRDMRDSGICAFHYPSVRDMENRRCIGLFEPGLFTRSQPDILSDWICQTAFDRVVFKQHAQPPVTVFTRNQFVYNGHLPYPA